MAFEVSYLQFRISRKFRKKKIDFSTLIEPTSFNGPSIPVDIIIPIFGESPTLERCLDSIVASRGIIPRVIIVNNGVPSNIETMVDSFEFVEKHIHNSENIGFGGACNEGMKWVESEFGVLLNSDIVLNQDTLRFLYDDISKQSRAGICSTVLVNEFGRYEEIGRVLSAYGEAFPIQGDQFFDPKNHVGIQKVPYSSFACVAIRKKVFEDIGGFDSQFFPAYSEDVDVAIRFFELGYASIVSLKSIALHYQGSSSIELADLAQIKEKNRVHLLMKHMEYFDAIPTLEQAEVYRFRLRRAMCANKESILIVANNPILKLDSIPTLIGCTKEELLLKHISLVYLDRAMSSVVELEEKTKTEFADNGIEVSASGQYEFEDWLRERICLYDKIFIDGSKNDFESSPLGKLVLKSQPDAVI